MQSGVIKWFNSAKGYGFIATHDNEDVFVHHTGLEADQDHRLIPGDEVTFEVVTGEQGPKAIGVRRISPPVTNTVATDKKGE